MDDYEQSGAIFKPKPVENYQLRLLPQSGSGYKAEWNSKEGLTFFLEYSTDLQNWSYVPDAIATGTGDRLEYYFDHAPEADHQAIFFRLVTSKIIAENPSLADFDNDGLTNSEEIRLGTDPLFYDTDMDLLSDGWEMQYDAFNPLVHDERNSKTGLLGDLDGDGITNFQEMVVSTNPEKWDTDGDGYSDGEELAVGSYPTLATDYPLYPKQ